MYIRSIDGCRTCRARQKGERKTYPNFAPAAAAGKLFFGCANDINAVNLKLVLPAPISPLLVIRETTEPLKTEREGGEVLNYVSFLLSLSVQDMARLQCEDNKGVLCAAATSEPTTASLPPSGNRSTIASADHAQKEGPFLPPQSPGWQFNRLFLERVLE